MTSFRKLISDNRGVALFIVLTSMATLAIFVGEITYVSQVNQKLAYDRLDQIKAHALAKSGLRLALLRIRAYAELKKTISSLTKSAGSSASAVSSMIPQDIMEKIWSEPITIPFSGDLSGLPIGARSAVEKFRKDSGMEGKLYITISAQSARFNLNSVLPSFAPNPSVSPTPKAGATPTPTPAAPSGTSPSATPATFDTEKARELLSAQLTDTFQKKFEEDEVFRDRYRNLRIPDLVDEILGWADLQYQSQAAQRATIPFKQAPFYDISELHYLPSMDDDIYDLLAEQFTAGVQSSINVNTIKEPVLAALVPSMTADERKKFFEFRDSTGTEDSNSPQGQANANTNNPDPNKSNKFKDDAGFYTYLKEKVAAFSNSQTKIDEYKTALTQRGITIIVDESNFVVRIEATVEQTKRILEAWVSILPSTTSSASGSTTTGNPAAGTAPTPDPNGAANSSNTSTQRSNLKITQLRFL